jgi:hypothetical protein
MLYRIIYRSGSFGFIGADTQDFLTDEKKEFFIDTEVQKLRESIPDAYGISFELIRTYVGKIQIRLEIDRLKFCKKPKPRKNKRIPENGL